MGMFGEEFVNGGVVLSVLGLGQFISVLCGSVGYLLTMSGNEKLYRNIVMITAIFQLLLIIVLVPQIGGLGAAIASSATLICMNIAATYTVYKKLGIITIPVYWTKSNGHK